MRPGSGYYPDYIRDGSRYVFSENVTFFVCQMDYLDNAIFLVGKGSWPTRFFQQGACLFFDAD